MSVIVGFIDNPEGQAAIDFAISEARRRDDRLVVINSKLGGSHEDENDYDQMREAMERLQSRLSSEGIDHELHEYVRGNSPARDLVDAADEHDADLIVIGIRRRSTTGKILLGSNALEILHDAPVPVVCVKRPR
jgi:nucleotide-binding universal stress UspA family protein